MAISIRIELIRVAIICLLSFFIFSCNYSAGERRITKLRFIKRLPNSLEYYEPKLDSADVRVLISVLNANRIIYYTDKNNNIYLDEENNFGQDKKNFYWNLTDDFFQSLDTLKAKK